MTTNGKMNLWELSDLNIGLILLGRSNAMQYDANDFPEPHRNVILELQKPNAQLVQAAKYFSPDKLQEMKDMPSSLDGLGDIEKFDWRVLQNKAMLNYQLGKELKKTGNKLEEGEDVDILPLHSTLTNFVANTNDGPKNAAEIDYSSYKPFMLCGYKPFDQILGGIPTDGPIIEIGMQGTGKSAMLFLQICSFLKLYPDKKACIYTLEMNEAHYLKRSLEMYPEFEPIVKSGRLFVSGVARGMGQVVAESAVGMYDIIGIDDIDGIVEDESAASYQKVYKSIREMCRFLKIPVIALAQPNRAAKIAERFLNVYDAAWSGAAENAAALFVCLQRVDPMATEWTDDRFPVDSQDGGERYFITFWKSRDGWLGDREPGKGQIGPGAIRIEPNPTTKRYNKLWVGEVYQNKLWTPGSGSKSRQIGKPQQKRRKVDDDD